DDVGEEEPIDTDADLLDERALLVKFEQARAAMRQDARAAHRGRRRTGARVDEHVPLRVGGPARPPAEIQLVRELEEVRDRVERDFGNRQLRAAELLLLLRGDGVAGGKNDQRDKRNLENAFQGPPPYRPADGEVGRAAPCGRRMIFCARHAVISEIHSSFSLRQSMPCVVANSFNCLPALPNLPTTVPSSSILWISPVIS